MSIFQDVPLLPQDPIFGVVAEFQNDPRKEKLNFCIGVYRSEEGLPVVFEQVKDVEAAFTAYDTGKDYLPIQGDSKFCRATGQLIFGKERFEKLEKRAYINQTVGGTGALRTGADLLKQQIGSSVYLSKPTWANHLQIFKECAFELKEYAYFNPETRLCDFEKMRESLEGIPNGSIVLLHASCHNPCGSDPTEEEWKILAELFKKKKLFPFFDCAYHGFGAGLKEDVQSINTFLDAGLEMLIAYSYSKNMGLYGERVGALIAITENETAAAKVGSYVRHLIRTEYSNCPKHGATIVSTILSDITRRDAWEKELSFIRKRIHMLRALLQRKMEEAFPEKKWNFFTEHIGMFSMCGFTEAEVLRLKEEFGIYMTKSSRINIAALNEKNIPVFIDALTKVLHR